MGKRNWFPDATSTALLQRYRAWRLASGRPPAESALTVECDYLRGMMYASVCLGGPDTLAALRDDPEMCATILREWPRQHKTLHHMCTAMLRFIECSADATRAVELRERLNSKLFPRSSDTHRWEIPRRMVGGSSYVERSRPPFSLA